MRMRAADRTQCQRRSFRAHIGAEAGCATDPRGAVSPLDPRADGAVGRRGLAGGVQHSRYNAAIAGAAAQHAAQRVHHFRLGRDGDPRQQVGCRHQHPRRANAALNRTMAQECALQRVRHAFRREPLDGADRATLGLAHGHEARTRLPPVQQHRAGATIAGIAADLRAGEGQILAQHLGQPPRRIAGNAHRHAVYGEGNVVHWCTASMRSSSSRAAASR